MIKPRRPGQLLILFAIVSLRSAVTKYNHVFARIFLFNDQTIKAIRKLKDGNGQFLWQPGLQMGQSNTLLGYRYETSTHMPVIGASAKPILFGDLSSYWIADREGRSIKLLNELYATTGQVGFRVTQRLDGRLVQQEGMKCLTMKSGT